MAQDLDDGEFWLPSQFLTEEDILNDFADSITTATTTTGFNSDLSSPVDSVTETESDEDEFLAELTRRMSRSSLLPKGLVLSGSPQSTLFPVGDGGSSRGSPTGPVSPPAAPAVGGYFKANETASFDLLHAAAGEVAKLRVRNEQKGTGYFDSNRGLRSAPLRPDFNGFYSNQSEISRHQPFQHFPQLWSVETMKQQKVIPRTENVEDKFYFPTGRPTNHIHNRPLGLSPAAWPPLQRPDNRRPHAPAPTPPQNLPSAKRESVGTGVFLPRTVNIIKPTDQRKTKNKPESTGRFRGQNNGIHGPRRVLSGSNPEIQLPSEWTY